MIVDRVLMPLIRADWAAGASRFVLACGVHLAGPAAFGNATSRLADVRGWPGLTTPCTLTARWTSALARQPKAAWEASP